MLCKNDQQNVWFKKKDSAVELYTRLCDGCVCLFPSWNTIYFLFSAFFKWFHDKYLSVQDNVFILSHIISIPLIKDFD